MTPNIEHLMKCLTRLAERLEEHEFLSILSAWRGPDNNDCLLKKRTTEIIRREILNEVGKIPDLDFCDGYGDGNSFAAFSGCVVALEISPVVVQPQKGSYRERDIPHFHNHARAAAEALVLVVEEEDDAS